MKSIPGVMIMVLLCSAATDAGTFPTSDEFSVTLPSGWVEAPPEALRDLEAALGQVSEGANTSKYDYGYQLATAGTWFEYPYILVQVNRGGRIPEGQLTQYEKIESELDEGLEKAEELLGSVISNIRQGETVYDEDNHVLWTVLTMNFEGVGEVRALVAVKLTEFGFIQLMGYATEDTFAQYSPIFRDAMQKLDVVGKYRYQRRITDRSPTIWGINLGKVAIAGLLGGLGGGVVALIGYLNKRRKSRGHQPG